MSSQIDKTKCISALLPIKNGSRYIEVISKIVTANMGPLDEILVIDDGSYDSTYSELTKWANFDNRVRIIKNSGSGLVSGWSDLGGTFHISSQKTYSLILFFFRLILQW